MKKNAIRKSNRHIAKYDPESAMTSTVPRKVLLVLFFAYLRKVKRYYLQIYVKYSKMRICSLAYFDLELIMFEIQGETVSSDEEPPPAKKPRRRIRRISERSRRTITAKLPPCHGPDCDQEVFLSSIIFDIIEENLILNIIAWL